MIKKSIEEFKNKYPTFELEQFIEAYLEGESREVLSSKFNIGEMPLRMFARSLGLEWIKSKRHASMLEFRYNLSLENNILDVNLVKELEAENKILSTQNRKLYQSLTLARDTNNALRKESRNEARTGDVYEDILNEFKNNIDNINYGEIIYQTLSVKTPTVLKDGLVLVLSDAHWGDICKQEVCNNTFNYSVAERRLNYMVDKVIQYPVQSKTLIVTELLDILKGIIHFGAMTSEVGLTESMLQVVQVYSRMYDKLARYYDNIDVYVTNSNHDRVFEKPVSHNKRDNFGIMLMKMVDMMLKAKGIGNVKFHYTENEYHLVNINTANVLVTHGDVIRTYKPSSQAERTKLQAICLGLFGDTYTHCVSGHLHNASSHSNEFGGWNIVNGSLVGSSEYGNTNGFTSIKPSQTILFIDMNGNIEHCSFVDLSGV